MTRTEGPHGRTEGACRGETADGVGAGPHGGTEGLESESGRNVGRAPSGTVIAAALAGAGHADVALHLFDELPSTSRWLEERAAPPGAAGGGGRPAADVAHGAPPALCAVDLQSAGHGRRGKRWVSVRGNVACSLLEHLPLAFPALGGLSLVTGIAVADAVRETTGLDVRVKWPNDLLVDGAKLGGLLIGVQACPTSSGERACTRVVSGIGLNVVSDERVLVLGIGGTSLEAAGADSVDRDHLVGLVAARVLDAHARFAVHGWSAFAARWPALDALAGRDVDVHVGEGVERGRALGVDTDGALRVDIAGTVRTFHGGEVSIRPTHPRAPERAPA